MTLDSSSSLSTADETNSFQSLENDVFPKGKLCTESGFMAGSVVKLYTEAKGGSATIKVEKTERKTKAENPDNWCYLFVHHKKVKAFEEQLIKDSRQYFIHTSIKYIPQRGDKNSVRRTVVQTVSGLIFLKGTPSELQTYLEDRFPQHRLCKNCSTGRVAEIPNSVMEPFMRVAQADPDRVRFLLRPFIYYSKNRTLLRITSGDFAGLEGYVIRMARDRKLVMDVGGMSVAIGNVHAERFEEVGKNEADKHERATFYKRNLHERNAFIDHYFHPVKTVQEVAAQTENIEILRQQTLSDIQKKRIDIKEAYETFCFMIEEIGYYYAPFIDRLKDALNPIFAAGSKVMQEIPRLIFSLPSDDIRRPYWEAEFDGLKAKYAYLFG